MTFGSNRGSKVIIVKMESLLLSETIEVWDQIWSDIKSKGRQKKSVCTYSVASRKKVNPNNPGLQYSQLRDEIQTLLDNDVPVVVAAGNEAQKDGGRPDVDTAPAVFEGPDYPIIVIGNCNNAGGRTASSQAGNHLAIWAPGTNVPCLDYNEDATSSVIKTGTSFCESTPSFLYMYQRGGKANAEHEVAAPLTAGVLATFLAYDEVPFIVGQGHIMLCERRKLK